MPRTVGAGLDGSLVGSAGLAVVAHAGRSVVCVRAGEQAADEYLPAPPGVPSAAAPFKPVVLGLDTTGPHDTLTGFAFEAAFLRATTLRVVHAWNEPPYIAYGLPLDLETNAALTEAIALYRSEGYVEVPAFNDEPFAHHWFEKILR